MIGEHRSIEDMGSCSLQGPVAIGQMRCFPSGTLVIPMEESCSLFGTRETWILLPVVHLIFPTFNLPASWWLRAIIHHPFSIIHSFHRLSSKLPSTLFCKKSLWVWNQPVGTLKLLKTARFSPTHACAFQKAYMYAVPLRILKNIHLQYLWSRRNI